MINKSLDELEEDIINYEKALKVANDISERNKIFIDFKNNIKLYLSAANNCFKDLFGAFPSPLVSTAGYDGLLQKGAVEISYKRKKVFYSEIDIFLNDERIKLLSDDKKKQVKNAAYVLRLYYSDLIE